MEYPGVNPQDREITERLELIESMMKSGRKSTEYWGWTFVLWGIAYFVAVGWSALAPGGNGRALAWPITMIAATLLTVAIGRRRTARKPMTERSRFLTSLWGAVGGGIFIFAFPVAFSGHIEAQSFMAAIEALLGVAHVASGLSLRWKTQVVVGGLWWATAVASCFLSASNVAIAFLAATLVCNIGFGTYLMIREGQEKARAGAGQVQHV